MWCLIVWIFILVFHSSLVGYLAEVISAKIMSHQFLLHFRIDTGSYDQHAKHQGVKDLLKNHFFHKGSSFEFIQIFFIHMGDPYEKSFFIEGPETHPELNSTNLLYNNM